MDNGLLSIDLTQPINNEESKKIEIKDKNNKIKDKLISFGNGKMSKVVSSRYRFHRVRKCLFRICEKRNTPRKQFQY